jgi:arylsulfatase A-like enzyme
MHGRTTTRRGFIRMTGGAAAALAAMPAPGQPQEQAKLRPNIVMILADDLGGGDLSCCGAKDLRTPNVDALAASGISFSNFYASCPVCSPTRAALLTGRYPPLVGVPGVIRTSGTDNWGHLAAQAVLLPAPLRQVGYHTALVGKWHLGLASPNLPNERGFDHFHGFLGDMMDDYRTHLRDGRNFMRLDGRTIDPSGHATDLFTQWAVEYVNGRKDARQPFFLYLAYNAPHVPIQPPDEWLGKVQQRQGGMAPARAKLAALIEHMDDGIGQVLAALKAAALADNTLVVFTSDNGGQLNVGARNGPVRSGKGTMYEGGLRVPACAAWPGRIRPGSQTDRVALTMDLFPTFLATAGAACPQGIDGHSLLPTLLGKDQPEEDRWLFWTRREGGKGFGGKTIEAVRHGRWKLLRNAPGGALELYDLAADPQEKNNLAGGDEARPKEYEDLAKALEDYVRRTEAVPWQRPAN